MNLNQEPSDLVCKVARVAILYCNSTLQTSSLTSLNAQYCHNITKYNYNFYVTDRHNNCDDL